MIKKGKLFLIFWSILIWSVLTIISVIFLASAVFGAELPDKAIMDYYDLKEYQLLKVEEFPAIPWIKKLVVMARFEKESRKSYEKIILLLDTRKKAVKTNRIMAIYHQKTDGKNIETIGCHADLDFLDTLGQKDPNWITYNSRCREELSDFLNILLSKIYQK